MGGEVGIIASLEFQPFETSPSELVVASLKKSALKVEDNVDRLAEFLDREGGAQFLDKFTKVRKKTC